MEKLIKKHNLDAYERLVTRREDGLTSGDESIVINIDLVKGELSNTFNYLPTLNPRHSMPKIKNLYYFNMQWSESKQIYRKIIQFI